MFPIASKAGATPRNWLSMLLGICTLIALAMIASGCGSDPEPDLSEYLYQKKPKRKSTDSVADSTPTKIYRRVDLVANELLVDGNGRELDYRTIQFTSPNIFFACGCEPCIAVGRKLAPYSKWVTCISQLPNDEFKAFLNSISWKGKAYRDTGGIVMSKFQVLDCPKIFDAGEFVLNELSESEVLKSLKIGAENEKREKEASRKRSSKTSSR